MGKKPGVGPAVTGTSGTPLPVPTPHPNANIHTHRPSKYRAAGKEGSQGRILGTLTIRRRQQRRLGNKELAK